jgi:hypothetical protein
MSRPADDGAGSLGDALARLRLTGAIFFRAEMTEAWSYESPPRGDIAAILHPGA